MIRNEKKALDITIELWEHLVETGNEFKGDWPKWEEYGWMLADCPLCAYYRPRGGNNCRTCPLADREAKGNYGCWGYSFGLWFSAKTKRTRKKYAKLFLEELRKL